MNIRLSEDAARRLTRVAIEERRSAADQAAYIVERQLTRVAPRPGKEGATLARTELKRIERREGPEQW